ncbi:hypothetical protein NUW58_g2401 [Xylaria curta]|uniref:Uncharacterized protein n=1 Tax=Xylaria curta TaxID=42375 RepID=A0ACC1PHC3_9PEZI|nr:hypothetical protein NUW58_g2401 [Xylaria curta]
MIQSPLQTFHLSQPKQPPSLPHQPLSTLIAKTTETRIEAARRHPGEPGPSTGGDAISPFLSDQCSSDSFHAESGRAWDDSIGRTVVPQPSTVDHVVRRPEICANCVGLIQAGKPHPHFSSITAATTDTVSKMSLMIFPNKKFPYAEGDEITDAQLQQYKNKYRAVDPRAGWKATIAEWALVWQVVGTILILGLLKWIYDGIMLSIKPRSVKAAMTRASILGLGSMAVLDIDLFGLPKVRGLQIVYLPGS